MRLRVRYQHKLSLLWHFSYHQPPFCTVSSYYQRSACSLLTAPGVSEEQMLSLFKFNFLKGLNFKSSKRFIYHSAEKISFLTARFLLKVSQGHLSFYL